MGIIPAPLDWETPLTYIFAILKFIRGRINDSFLLQWNYLFNNQNMKPFLRVDDQITLHVPRLQFAEARFQIIEAQGTFH